MFRGIRTFTWWWTERKSSKSFARHWYNSREYLYWESLYEDCTFKCICLRHWTYQKDCSARHFDELNGDQGGCCYCSSRTWAYSSYSFAEDRLHSDHLYHISTRNIFISLQSEELCRTIWVFPSIWFCLFVLIRNGLRTSWFFCYLFIECTIKILWILSRRICGR